jgi:predicted MPP superfamily phosphohydrolase
MRRREFLLAATGMAVALGAYGVDMRGQKLKYVHYDLATGKWPEGHAPLRIALVADLHVGCLSVPLKRLDQVVAQLNQLSADIIVMPGDFVVSDEDNLQKIVAPELIAEKLAGLRARHGVHAVLGNHDWNLDGARMWRAFEDHGIGVLENDAVKITRPESPGQDFWLMGLADDRTRMPDLKAAFEKVKDSDPVVLMCHDPGTFLDIDARPVVTMCGHTHGGQVRLPFLGAAYLPSRAPLRYAYGHISENNRDLIVTSGVGTSSLPLRFNCPPEIVTVKIEPARPL